MISFTRASLQGLCIHYVGNKGLGEDMVCSEKPVQIKDDFLNETLLRYFSAPFKSDAYFEFKDKVDPHMVSVKNACRSIFERQEKLQEQSAELAKHLYNHSVHPKIKGGELIVCYFRDVMLDGELCDAIGLFKSEIKETYLRIYQHINDFELDYENGININKIDKGCLVFNTDKKQGYKLSVIDNNKGGAENALYWEEDFLNARLKAGAYYHTRNFMETSRGFCEEVLTEENNVNRDEQRMMLNRSTAYFKEKDNFKLQDFEKDVLVQPELVKAFRDYRQGYHDRMDLTSVDDFDVSAAAVKKYQKYMRSVVKLDKNFHLYIHSRHDYVEKGFDEAKGLKFYKLYYINEE